MNGQWTGIKFGDAPHDEAQLIIDVDLIDNRYEAIAFHWPTHPPFVCSVVAFSIPVGLNPFTTEGFLWHDQGPNLPFADASVHWSHVLTTPQSLSRRIYIEGDWNAHRLRISVTSDLGSAGHAVLTRLPQTAKSSFPSTQLSWKELKERLFECRYRKYIFRGQANSDWPLRTLFHREGRANLFRYKDQDVPAMFLRLSSTLSSPLNINVDDDRGGFIHLLQHHGYPTPLLDWTYSPFVAAFFAFREHRRVTASDGERMVRIYKFDHEAWTTRFEPIPLLASTRRNLSFMEFGKQNNPRAIPQHALSSVTTIDDVEGYIVSREKDCRIPFLEAFDIPVSESPRAISDLRLMGITAGSLFPGLDGACEEMRSLRFP